ncbi:hypothetical protein MKZ38_000280 [Zalerion maritima]|uniref:PD-(D/E)XK nuclease-like domain-containing protein n=1 Tax=Zalerion maritima TaxID=339359 RepID=A0AAD5RFX0_9PEZI|nr:hypothetical protein MKZ38_000280 [Zalerion maritima]
MDINAWLLNLPATKVICIPPPKNNKRRLLSPPMSEPSTPEKRRKTGQERVQVVPEIDPERTPRADQQQQSHITQGLGFGGIFTPPVPTTAAGNSSAASVTSTDTSSTASTASGRSSPRKRQRTTKYVRFERLGHYDVPDPIKSTYSAIYRIASQLPFLPREQKAAVEQYQLRQEQQEQQQQQQARSRSSVYFRDKVQLLLLDRVFLPPTDTAAAATSPDGGGLLPGRCPMPAEIDYILDWTDKLLVRYGDEPLWNEKVHSRLLESVFQPPPPTSSSALGVIASSSSDDLLDDSIDFVNCTTATPFVEFVPPGCTAHKVDFSLFVNPFSTSVPATCTNPGRLRTAADRRHPLTHTFNHTEYAYLQSSPICVPIETKRPDRSVAEGELQLGVWLNCHWRFLASSIEIRLREKAAAAAHGSGASTADAMVGEATQAAAKPQAEYKAIIEQLASLPFIPGVHVIGTEWYVVYSTPPAAVLGTGGAMVGDDGGIGTRSNKVQLVGTVWRSQRIAAADTVVGVYQVAFALRELAKWGRDVYWPWFEKNIL